jgi:hypothetical protein
MVELSIGDRGSPKYEFNIHSISPRRGFRRYNFKEVREGTGLSKAKSSGELNFYKLHATFAMHSRPF